MSRIYTLGELAETQPITYVHKRGGVYGCCWGAEAGMADLVLAGATELSSRSCSAGFH